MCACVYSIKRLPFTESRNSAETLMNAFYYLFIQVFQMCMMYDDDFAEYERRKKTRPKSIHGKFEIVNIFVKWIFLFSNRIKIVGIQNSNQTTMKTFILFICSVLTAQCLTVAHFWPWIFPVFLIPKDIFEFFSQKRYWHFFFFLNFWSWFPKYIN